MEVRWDHLITSLQLCINMDFLLIINPFQLSYSHDKFMCSLTPELKYTYSTSGAWKKETTPLPTYQTYSFSVNHQYCCWCGWGPFCSFDLPIKCFMVCAKLLYIDQSACRNMAAVVLLDGCNGTFIASGMADVLYEIAGEEYGIGVGGTRIYLGTLIIQI